MFGNLGLPELAIIVLFGLVIFGPDRLPKAASDAAQMIKKLRAMSHTAMDDFRSDLGPEFQDMDIRSLHPRRIVEDAWHSWEDQPEHDDVAADDAEPAAATKTTAPKRATKATAPKRGTSTTAAAAAKPAAKRVPARTTAKARGSSSKQT